MIMSKERSVAEAMCRIMVKDYDWCDIIKTLTNRDFVGKRHPLIRAGVGVAFLSVTRTTGYYCTTGFSFLPLAMYNGKKGKGLKWMLYLFYPGHLLLLAAIKHLLLV